jgi:hypothetical protein
MDGFLRRERGITWLGMLGISSKTVASMDWAGIGVA